jgi:hypothetical protein
MWVGRDFQRGERNAGKVEMPLVRWVWGTLRSTTSELSEISNSAISCITYTNSKGVLIPLIPIMPRQSKRQQMLNDIDQAALVVARARYQHVMEDDDSTDSISSLDSQLDLTCDSDLDIFMDIMLSPSSPLSPAFSGLSDLSDGDISSDDDDHTLARYNRLQDSIATLWDEVLKARVLHRPDEPLPRAPQLHLLVHFGQHRPLLFRHKLRVDPDIFDNILDLISGHHIFHNNSNNSQLPVAIQLAIFLNRAGHYGNSISLLEVSQWAGVSVGSVVNCTNRVMVALLDQHDAFMGFPPHDSEDFNRAQRYSAKATTCPEWQNGVLAVDGTTVDLYATPGFYHEAFYDRKSKYSLGCQVSLLFIYFSTVIN